MSKNALKLIAAGMAGYGIIWVLGLILDVAVMTWIGSVGALVLFFGTAVIITVKAHMRITSKSGPEYCTFDETLKELHIDEARLKRLVNEGEIRPCRIGDEMKFKKSDIDSLDLSDPDTRTIDLSQDEDECTEVLTDDLVFDYGEEGAVVFVGDKPEGDPRDLLPQDVFKDDLPSLPKSEENPI